MRAYHDATELRPLPYCNLMLPSEGDNRLGSDTEYGTPGILKRHPAAT